MSPAVRCDNWLAQYDSGTELTKMSNEMEDSIPEFGIEIDNSEKLQGLIYMESEVLGQSLGEDGEVEVTSFAQSYDDDACNENDSVDDNEPMQIPSYFIPDNFDTKFIHGNHHCVVCETYPIVGYRLHAEHFKTSQGWPGEGCCHECFKELFKIGTRSKKEEWLILFEPEQLERDVSLQIEYREKFFGPDDLEQSDKDNNMFEEKEDQHIAKRSSPLRKIFYRKDGLQYSTKKINSDNDDTAEETYIESPEKCNVKNQEEKRSFHILGTSSYDLSTHSRVLSPSLMESLLCFVPEQIACENFWLKYSSVRDGASLNTLQNLTRASSHTIMAIQTTRGDIFGSFTSSPWQIRKDYFGSGVSFVWKMRQPRMETCFVRDEKIRVFPNSILNDSVQLCTNELVGVGGGEIRDKQIREEMYPDLKEAKELGFAILLDNHLHRGTTSPSATFCSPMLDSDTEDGVFEVQNLEVWTFTPCTEVDNAERLELKKYLRQNPRGLASYHSAFSFRRLDRRAKDTDLDKNISKQRSLIVEHDDTTSTATSVTLSPVMKKKWNNDDIEPEQFDDLEPFLNTDARQKEDIYLNVDGKEVAVTTAFEVEENKGSIDVSNNFNLPAIGVQNIGKSEECYNTREKGILIENSLDCSEVTHHTTVGDEQKSNISCARSFFCCDNVLNSDDSIKVYEHTQMSTYAKEQLVECEDLKNVSEIKCDVDDSNIELSGEFSESTAQVGNTSIEVLFTEKKEECAKAHFSNITPASDSIALHAPTSCNQCVERIEGPSDKYSQEIKSALKVDEFHDCQDPESMNEINESSISSETVANDTMQSVGSENCDNHSKLLPVECMNNKLRALDLASASLCDECVITENTNVTIDLFATPEKGAIDLDLEANFGEEQDTSHSFHTPINGDIPKKADSTNDAMPCAKNGHMKATLLNSHNLLDASSDFILCNDEKDKWAEFPVFFSTPEKCIDEQAITNRDYNEHSVSTLINTPGEFPSDKAIFENIECNYGDAFATPLKWKVDAISIPSPVTTPEEIRQQESSKVYEEPCPLQNQNMALLSSTRTQREEVEIFCMDVKAAPVEILKLNREKKWQKRFLTVSKEVTNLSNWSGSEKKLFSCPVALLWVKKIVGVNGYSLINFDILGRGGIAFTRILRVTLEHESDALKNSPLSKQQKKKYSNSVGVTIDYQSGNNDPSVVSLACSKEAGELIVSSCRAIISAMVNSTKDNTFRRSRFESTNESVERIDSPNILLQSLQKDGIPSPLGIEAHPHQQAHPIHFDDDSRTSDEDDAIIMPKRLFNEVTELRASAKQYSKTMSEDLGKQNESILESEASIVKKEIESKSGTESLELSLRESESSLLEKSEIIQSLETRMVDTASLERLLEASTGMVMEKSKVITNLEDRLVTALKLREELDEATEIIAEKTLMITHLNNGLAEALEYRKQLNYSQLELEDKIKVIDHLEERMAIISELQKHLEDANAALFEKKKVIERMEEHLANALEFEKKCDESNASLVDKNEIIEDLEEQLSLALEVQRQLEASNSTLLKKNAIIRDLEKRLTIASHFQKQLKDSTDVLSKKNGIIDELEKRLILASEVSKMLDVANTTLSKKSKIIIDIEEKLNLLLNVEKQLNITNTTLTERNRTITNLEQRLSRSLNRVEELSKVEGTLSKKRAIVKDLVKSLETASETKKQLENANVILLEKGDLIADLERRLNETLKLEVELSKSQAALSEKTDQVLDLEKRLERASEMKSHLTEVKSHLREKITILDDYEKRLAKAMLMEKNIDKLHVQLNEKSGIIITLDTQVKSALNVQKDLDDTNALLAEKNQLITILEDRLTSTTNLKKELSKTKSHVIEQRIIIEDLNECAANTSDLKERLDEAKSSLSEKATIVVKLEDRLKGAEQIQEQLDRSTIILSQKCLIIEDLEKRLANTLLLEGQLEKANVSIAEKSLTIQDLEKHAVIVIEVRKELDEAKSTLAQNSTTICNLEMSLEVAVLTQNQFNEANATLSENRIVINNLEQRLETASRLKEELDNANAILLQNRDFIADQEQRLSAALLLEKEIKAMNATVAEKTKIIRAYETQLTSASEVQIALKVSGGKVSNLENRLTKAIDKCNCLREEIECLNTHKELQNAAIMKAEEKVALLSQKHYVSVENLKTGSRLKEAHYMEKIRELEERVSQCNNEMNVTGSRLVESQEDAKSHSLIIEEKKIKIQGLESKLVEMADVHLAGEQGLTFELAGVEASLSLAINQLEELTARLVEVEEEKTSIAQNAGLEMSRLKSLTASSNKENIELLDKLDAYDTKEETLVAAIEGLKAATETVRGNLDKKRNQISDMTVSSNKLKDHVTQMQNGIRGLQSEQSALSKKLKDANKENKNLKFNIDDMKDEKRVSEEENEKQLQILQNEKDDIADELGCAIQLGVELDNAMGMKRSEVAKLATQLDIQNSALNTASSKIEKLLGAQETLKSSNADKNDAIQQMEEEDKLLKAKMAIQKEEIDDLTNGKATDTQKIDGLQIELKTFEAKVKVLEEQATKLVDGHEIQLLKSVEDIQRIHEDVVQTLKDELGRQRNEDLQLDGGDISAKMRILQEECGDRVKVTMETKEGDEDVSNFEKSEQNFYNACHRQYGGFCKFLLFVVICAIVGRKAATHKLPWNWNVLSQFIDYEQQTLDMKVQLQNAASHAEDDRIQVVKIIKEAMNHEIRADLNSRDILESKRLGVLEQLGEDLESDTLFPTTSVSHVSQISDYLTLVISSYTELTDEKSDTYELKKLQKKELSTKGRY